MLPKRHARASVLGAGGTALAATLAATLVNARFAVMGVAVASSLSGGPLRRAIEGQATVDASWALAAREGGRFDRDVLIGTTPPQYIAWVGGAAVGVFAGDALGDPEAIGLDVVFPAFFLGLLIEERRASKANASFSSGSYSTTRAEIRSTSQRRPRSDLRPKRTRPTGTSGCRFPSELGRATSRQVVYDAERTILA